MRRLLRKSESCFRSCESLVNADAELVRPLPTALDNGQRSPRKLLRAVVAQLLGRKSKSPGWSLFPTLARQLLPASALGGNLHAGLFNSLVRCRFKVLQDLAEQKTSVATGQRRWQSARRGPARS